MVFVPGPLAAHIVPRREKFLMAMCFGLVYRLHSRGNDHD
jgi:hypothetical protein